MWTYNRPASDELMHYGILGQKWGVRRFQNPDGSLTPAGKERYGLSKGQAKSAVKKAKKEYRKSEGWRADGATGAEWAAVRKKNKKAIESDAAIREETKKRNEAYRKAESAYDKGNMDASDKYQDAGDLANEKITKRKLEITRSFTSQYQEALLKDIGYADIELGKQMLVEYGIDNDDGKPISVGKYMTVYR